MTIVVSMATVSFALTELIVGPAWGKVCAVMHTRSNTASDMLARMKPMTLAGALLLVLGLVALAYQGFTYKSRETVVDIGPIHATAETEKTVPIPPIAGGAAVLAGVVLIIAGQRKR